MNSRLSGSIERILKIDLSGARAAFLTTLLRQQFPEAKYYDLLSFRREKNYPLSFWRTSTGYEVDLILGDLNAAIEFKAKKPVDSSDLRSLKALKEEQRVKKAMVVSLDPTPRKLANEILVLPWTTFCEKLWAGDVV